MTLLTRFAVRPRGRPALRGCIGRALAAASSVNDSADAGTRLRNSLSSAKLVKRKVAIVGGYKGTGYHGLQLNNNVNTIEDEIRRAVFEAGAMRESNFEDLGKIDWARSSRTDKGVHASCIVVRSAVFVSILRRKANLRSCVCLCFYLWL